MGFIPHDSIVKDNGACHVLIEDKGLLAPVIPFMLNIVGNDPWKIASPTVDHFDLFVDSSKAAGI